MRPLQGPFRVFLGSFGFLGGSLGPFLAPLGLFWALLWDLWGSSGGLFLRPFSSTRFGTPLCGHRLAHIAPDTTYTVVSTMPEGARRNRTLDWVGACFYVQWN